MNAVQIPQTTWKDILDAIVATGAPFDGAVLNLFKNNFVPSAGMSLGDLTIADFTGYGPSSTVVWDAAAYLPDGTAIIAGDKKVFTVGATPTVLNTIYGWYLTNAGGTVLLAARRLDTAVVLSGAGQVVEVVPTYPAYLPV